MDEIARVTPSWRGVSHARLDGGAGAAVSGASTRRIRAPRFCSMTSSRRPTGRRRSIAVEFLPPAELPDDEYPFILNTGRQMYHWHTGTMTRRSFALDARESTPTVELNPADAADAGRARRRHDRDQLTARAHHDRGAHLGSRRAAPGVRANALSRSGSEPAHESRARSVRRHSGVQGVRGEAHAGTR